jgi:hypothetical protein
VVPLAESLRQSNLKGFTMKGIDEKLIATLFADDTMVYFDTDDDFGSLVEILEE